MTKIIEFITDFFISIANAYYSFKYKSYFKTHHFEITIKDKFNLSIKWLNHEQYIESKQEILDKEKERVSLKNLLSLLLSDVGAAFLLSLIVVTTIDLFNFG